MKIAIIGAGAAGLASLRHSLDQGHECTVFEQTGNIGGTWNYVDNVGFDEYGLPIHSSMYKGLRTNLPKELMQYEDFPYNGPEVSYITQEDVLRYIKNYTNKFNLLPHIRFFKHVLQVKPLPERKWTIKVKDMRSNNSESSEYDAVFVCVGNYSVPKVPKIQDIEKFKGKVIHSHNYRKPDIFKNKTVLVIGAGPSGIDISRIVSGVAEKVFISIRSGTKPVFKFSDNVFFKPEIQKFREKIVTFKDGTEEEIGDVIFCTGYVYSYPFLSPECGIKVENNWVKSLYKQIVNIEHSTMGFIGIPFRVCPFPLFGIQVRFFLTFLQGGVKISKEEMLQELNEYMLKKKEEGSPPNHAHLLGLKQGAYMDELAETANIKKVPPVIQKLYHHVHTAGKGKYDISYKLVDDNEYVQVS